MEHITSQRGDGQKGKYYQGPTWVFRESDKGYWRSEFVVITPKDRKLDIESRGVVGEDHVRAFGTFVEHRWRARPEPARAASPNSALGPRIHPQRARELGHLAPGQARARGRRRVRRHAARPARREEGARRGAGHPRGPGRRAGARALPLRRGQRVRGRRDRPTPRRRRARWLAGVGVPAPAPAGRHQRRARDREEPASGGPARAHRRDRELHRPRDLRRSGRGTPRFQYVIRRRHREGPAWVDARSGDKFTPYGFVPVDMRGQAAYRLVRGPAGVSPDVVAATGVPDGGRLRGASRRALRTARRTLERSSSRVTGADGTSRGGR